MEAESLTQPPPCRRAAYINLDNHNISQLAAPYQLFPERDLIMELLYLVYQNMRRRNSCLCAIPSTRLCNQRTGGLVALNRSKVRSCLAVPRIPVNNTRKAKRTFPVIPFLWLTEPFSITLLSMMTALVFCSQIMSQKCPHVFLRGP